MPIRLIYRKCLHCRNEIDSGVWTLDRYNLTNQFCSEACMGIFKKRFPDNFNLDLSERDILDKELKSESDKTDVLLI